MIFSNTVPLLGLIAATLAAPASCNATTDTAIYKSVKIEPFITVNARTSWPSNATVHGGAVGIAPIPSGQVQGKFVGHLLPNISVETERLMPGSNGGNTIADSRWIIESESNKEERILVTLKGITTYANNALHGFGTAVMETDNKKWDWVNWAFFLVEWQSTFATGTAEFQISEIKSGGRRDGKPIPALEPPAAGN